MWKSGLRRAVFRGWTLKALLLVDQLGFHGAVTVVLVDPVGEAFGKWKVVERVAEVGDGAFYSMISLMGGS